MKKFGCTIFLVLFTIACAKRDSAESAPGNSAKKSKSRKEKKGPTPMGGSSEGGFKAERFAGDPKENVLESYLSGKQSHPGSSKIGRAFDVGPRQAATIDPRLPRIQFPLSGCTPEAAAFFNQGLVQVQAFATYEAERSFRQAFAIDRYCITALWGIALAQITFSSGNMARGKKIARLAYELSLRAPRSPLEMTLIKALHDAYESKSKGRYKIFAKTLYELAQKTGNDEIAALAGLYIWNFPAYELIGIDRKQVDALLRGVVTRNPRHPAHHAIIHLWNTKNDEANALENANLVGRSTEGIAHMWHMASHVYSPLGRRWDAELEFEAAQRLDHAYALEVREFPYVVHNYAHNVDFWMTVLIKAGAYRAAQKVAYDAMALPLHPLYNEPEFLSDPYNSPFMTAGYDMSELFFNNNLWREMIEWDARGLWKMLYSRKHADPELPVKLIGRLLWAYNEVGNNEKVAELRATLETYAKASKNARKEAQVFLKLLDLRAKFRAAPSTATLAPLLKAKDRYDEEIFGDFFTLRELSALGDYKNMLAVCEAHLKLAGNSSDIYALLYYTEALVNSQREEEAKKVFAKARTCAMKLEPDSELYALGSKFAGHFGFHGADWRQVPPIEPDFTNIPPRDLTLPLEFPGLSVPRGLSLTEPNGGLSVDFSALLQEHPQNLVVFVLGGACLSCNTQLNDLIDNQSLFPDTGIIVVSSDPPEAIRDYLQKNPNIATLENFRLYANPDLSAFKAFRIFDDFDQVPFHGSFLIRDNGKIMWQDRADVPFGSWKWLSEEIKRLHEVSLLSDEFINYEAFPSDKRF